MTLLALVVAVTAGAQTGLVEFPYNPDADNDDVIGTADLLALLSLYGSEFSEENVYMSEDSTSALVYTGQHTFYRCYKSCKDLPGNWRLPNYYDMLGQELSSFDFCSGCSVWIDWMTEGQADINGASHRSIYVSYANDNSDGVITSAQGANNDKHCLCYTHERPKVEYSYCMAIGHMPNVPYDHDYVDEFEDCCNSKVQDGWYPLGGLSKGHTGDGGQAFWRWAE